MSVKRTTPSEHDPKIACPKDNASMDKYRIDDIVVDRCSSCSGVWLDLGEQAALLGLKDATEVVAQLNAAKNQSPNSETETHTCPRDGQRLTSLRDPKQPHIEYELCTHCGGTFFDGGELEDLSEYTIQERLSSLIR